MTTLIATQISFAANSSTNDPPKTATCVISEGANDTKNKYAFYLAGFETGGSAYCRTISAPIFELTVKSDGSVELNTYPCKDDADIHHQQFDRVALPNSD